MSMSVAPRILVFAGSLRTESYNKKLARIAADAARRAGGDATLIDLRDFAMPIFDEDLETRDGLPPNARRFKDALLANDGLFISAPEYNSSITAALKNAIDWASRPVPGEAPLGCFIGKVAALLSASPGSLGGLRGLVHVRAILGNIKVLVLPEQFALVKAGEAFDAEGRLKNAKHEETVSRIAAALVSTIAKLKA